MSESAPCPSRQDLERYTLGQVAEAEAKHLEAPLQDCPRCVAGLNDLHPGDTLADALRSNSSLVEAAEQEDVTDLIARLKDLSKSVDDTSTGELHLFAPE